MIVVGVDPGARHTGVVAVNTNVGGAAVPTLLTWTTVERVKTEPLLDVSTAYLHRLHAIVAEMLGEHDATVLAVEGVRRPSQHLNGQRARGGRGGAAADPTALLATAMVLGSLLGRRWGTAMPGGGGVDVVVVPPGRNGSQGLAGYPAPIAVPPGGRGQDARRHARSAYDVARCAPAWWRLAQQRGAGAYVG